MREQYDTIVIGGGQAGLVMSAALQQRGREHVVLERGQVGGRWRTERWDSLRFQFPNWSLELPGYSYSGEDPDGFAHWREILRVIEDYAARMHLPVREHTEVTALRADDGGFVLSVADRTIYARQVVVATGPFQRPRIPQFSEGVAPTVLQTDPTRYRREQDLPDGAVLVVGTGASGCRSARNCCVRGGPCSSRFPGTGASPGVFAAGTSPGGWTGWAASNRRSTASPDGSGLRRSSSPA